MTDFDIFLGSLRDETDRFLAFLRLEEYYRLADEEGREAIRAGWPFEQRWFIPGLDYSDWDHIVFEPLTGVDRHGLDAEARLEARLTYHAIDNARGDYRDAILDICLCSHAGLASGIDMERLFREATEISAYQVGRVLLTWLQQPAEWHSLWAMGFRELRSENKVVFEWIGFDPDYDAREPKHLDKWGREIAG